MMSPTNKIHEEATLKCLFGTFGKGHYQTATSISKSIIGGVCRKPKYRLAFPSIFITEIHVNGI